MCGRFTRSSPPAAIAEEFGVEVDPGLATGPRFNVCPSENILVIARAAPAPTPGEVSELGEMGQVGELGKLGWMRWGLVPWFARDPNAGPRSINARAETIATNRAFREAFERRRCLVVADGFYEWRRVGTKKMPYFIRLRARRPFAFAGVWDRWKAPGGEGEPLVSCAIVTCAANALVAPIHDRMPVIVPPPARARWLVAGGGGDDLTTLLRPYPDGEMEAYPVSRLVNAPRHDEPECIRRVDDADG
jgi:putative SOS response-associated peptidase YedK